MSARNVSFREADLKRALAAAQKSGIRQYRVEIAVDGTIAVVVGADAVKQARKNSMDELLGR
ncbi:MAG TPA: hypothetical protein VKQ27_08745 [Acetobacteraceae bacterium]|nr:hypothetical protein [Acetobacteraceae bacterium]